MAILALVGLGVVFLASRRHARKVAESRIDTYIKSAEGIEMVKNAISDEVAAQLERRSFVIVQPQKPEANEPRFQPDPKAGGGQ